jgi:hypothetical protein
VADVAFVAVMVGAIVAAAAYVAGCDRLERK